MNKSQLKTLIHGMACGAFGSYITDSEEDESTFFGLCNEMGVSSYARFIQSLRWYFARDGADDGRVWFTVDEFDEFDSVPAATSYIWSRRESLFPWKTSG